MLDAYHSHTDQNVIVMSCADELPHANRRLDAIDAQAEREAEALAWMEEELGIAQPLAPLQRRQLNQYVFKNCRYPMAASLRANDRLQRASTSQLAGWIVSDNFEITTAADRARRALNKTRKRLILQELARYRAPLIPFRLAMRVGHVSQRALHRAIQLGRVKRSVQNGVIMVEVASFRAYAAKRSFHAK